MRKSFRRILVKRVFNAFITIILIMSLNFVLFRLVPVDPAAIMIEKDPQTTQAAYWRNVELMGLNDTLWEQFLKYLEMTFTGQWGESYYYEQPVFDVTEAAIYWTILLIGVSTALTFLAGIALGKIAALRRGKTADLTITGFGIFFYGMPVFWFAIILLIIFNAGLYVLINGNKFILNRQDIIPVSRCRFP